MTRVLISDTSILVDLERGGLLEAAFRLDVDFAVPDLLFEEELKDYNGDRLRSLGLLVQELDGGGVERAMAHRETEPLLSIADAFALSLAQDQTTTLLTGDAALRSLAEQEGVDCHGLLWLLDLMFEASVVAPEALRNGLDAVFVHPRCRLPKDQVRSRLKRYAEAIAAEND